MPREKKVQWTSIGGFAETKKEIHDFLTLPVKSKGIFDYLGITTPRGLLLFGPSGSGKTLMATAACYEAEIPFKRLNATEFVSGVSGESESKIRKLFSEALKCQPCIVFIDEIDVLAPRRDSASREMERRILAQFIASLDDIQGSGVFILATTSRPESIDPVLRRAGRLDKEIGLGIPDEGTRLEILQALVRKVRIGKSVSLNELANSTPGYVGADLDALVKEAGVAAVIRLRNQNITLPSEQFKETLDSKGKELSNNENSSIEIEEIEGESKETSPKSKEIKAVLLDPIEGENGSGECNGNAIVIDEEEKSASIAVELLDFQVAMQKIIPAAKREGFTVVPDTTWDDIGALGSLKSELEISIILPIKSPSVFLDFGISAPAGVLLYGPPGCGKTLLAKATANASHANFIAVKGPELLNKYVGESERAVRSVFQRAKLSAPCIIFFDELDALCPKRGNDGNNVTERVVNQLLTEMDGIESRKQVFIMAATNRPDIIDSAMMRPGRLDKLLLVPLPTQPDRESILKTLIRKCPMGDTVQIEELSKDEYTNGFTGADLSSLVKEASIMAIKNQEKKLEQNHFLKALEKIYPSISSSEIESYNKITQKLRHAR